LKKIKITDQTPESFRQTIIRFMMKYGDGHITKKAIRWLKQTPFSDLHPLNGDLIHVVVNSHKKIVAVLAIAHYGLEQAIIAVHPQIRKKGIANKLVMEAIEDIDRLYVKVANDNVASLKLCFSVGMKAFDLIKGPTGKPTLVLGLGKWDQKEWESYHSK